MFLRIKTEFRIGYLQSPERSMRNQDHDIKHRLRFGMTHVRKVSVIFLNPNWVRHDCPRVSARPIEHYDVAGLPRSDDQGAGRKEWRNSCAVLDQSVDGGVDRGCVGSFGQHRSIIYHRLGGN